MIQTLARSMPYVFMAAFLALPPTYAHASGFSSYLTLCLAGAAPVRPDEWWTAWSFAPEVVVPLLLAGIGAGAFWRRNAARSGQPEPWRAFAFAGGYILLALAVTSPLCRMAADLASAHMVQHLVLVALAPPLLVVGLPRHLLLRFCIPGIGMTAVIYGAMIWAWHVPPLYTASLVSEPVHLLLYATLLLASLAFWINVRISVSTSDGSAASAIIALLVTLIHTGMLGALLSFSTALWYPIMELGAVTWGLTPLEDQQLAGLIMWVPMGGIYLVAALAVVGAALARSDRRNARLPAHSG